MNIYFFDKNTKEYVGSGVAQIDPLESQKQGEDVFLMPPNATTMVPPESIPDGNVAKFAIGSSTWELVADHRGETSYKTDTGAVKVIDYLGDVEEGYQLDKPVIPPSAAQIDESVSHYAAQASFSAVPNDLTQDMIDAMDSAKLKQHLMAKAKAIYNSIMESGLGDYPVLEMIGWAKQEQEALTWIEDQNNSLSPADVPTMQYLCHKRDGKTLGEVTSNDLDILAGKIIANANIFAKFYGNVSGQRQSVEFQLEGAYNNNVTEAAKKQALLNVDLSSILLAAQEIASS